MTKMAPTSGQLEEPLAQLERQLIRAYVADAGEEIDELLEREDASAKKLLAEASLHASLQLTEAESRLHYLRSLRGEVDTTG
jgi:hypothetical protein